jgi:hypothetical protein
MKLREAESFGPTDHHRIRTRDIEPAFHDVGRKQNVCRAFNESHHSVVNFVNAQLPVKTDDAELRGNRLHSRQHRVEILNARTNEEALPMAPLLAQQCRGNSCIRKRRNLRDDRKTLNGRRSNNAEIPKARKTCREGPRYRRRTHPKGMATPG